MSERLQGSITAIEEKVGQSGKPYKKVTVNNVAYYYFQGTAFKLGDTISFSTKQSGQYLHMQGVNVVGGTAPAPAPTPPATTPAKVDYIALRALLEEKLGTDEIVDKRVAQKVADLKGLIKPEAALVLVAKDLKVSLPLEESRTIHTPAEGKSGSETTTIATTTYPAPDPGPLCKSPWSDKKNDIRYASVKVYPTNHTGIGIEFTVEKDNVEEIWHLWSHPRLLFIKQAGIWTTHPARGHGGVVWTDEPAGAST